jgi:hypothetical protein
LDTAPSATRRKTYTGDLKTVGKQAESIVLKWLKANPTVLGVTDLSDIEQVQRTDADFLIKFREGGHALAEVKYDRHIHWEGNLVFELARIYHEARPENAFRSGWSASTVAQWLIVYSPQESALYIFPIDRLRSAVQRYTQKKRKQTTMLWIPTDQTKSTIILLIPLSELRHIYRRYNLPEEEA